MATFPELFGGVYVFAKNKGWNNRDKLIEEEEEEEDVTSGGAMNTLSLEDRAPGFSVPVQESGGPPQVTVIPWMSVSEWGRGTLWSIEVSSIIVFDKNNHLSKSTGLLICRLHTLTVNQSTIYSENYLCILLQIYVFV